MAITKKAKLVRGLAGVVGALVLAGCSAESADDAGASGPGEESDLCAGKCDQAAACSYTGGFVESVQKGAHDLGAGVALTLTTADPISNDVLAAVLDALDAAHVRVSFFVSKSFAQNLSAVNASRIRQRGDLVSPYVFIDYKKPIPPTEKLKEQLFDTETALAEHHLLTPESSVFFRFPYGGSCGHQDELHARIGRISVGWHTHDQGLGAASATAWRSSMNQRVAAGNGGVVLLHLSMLTKKRAIEAFAPWVKELAKKYTVTTLTRRVNFPSYANRLDNLLYRVPGPAVNMAEAGDLYAGVTEKNARVFFRARSENYGAPVGGGEVELHHSEGCAAGTCKEQVWTTNENSAHCMDPSPIENATCSMTSSVTGKGAMLIPSDDFGDYQYLGKGLGNGYFTLSTPPMPAGVESTSAFRDWEIVITGTNPKAERNQPLLVEWTGSLPVTPDVSVASGQATLKSGGLPGAPVLFKKTGAKLNPISVTVELDVPASAQSSLDELSLFLAHADWPDFPLATGAPVITGTKVRFTASVDLNAAVFAKEAQMVDLSRSFTRSPLGAWSIRASGPDAGSAKLTSFRIAIN